MNRNLLCRFWIWKIRFTFAVEYLPAEHRVRQLWRKITNGETPIPLTQKTATDLNADNAEFWKDGRAPSKRRRYQLFMDR